MRFLPMVDKIALLEVMLPQRYLKGGAFLGACLIGLAAIWLSRFYIYSDPISYMEIARQNVERPWLENVNGYWSPLLPVLIALAFKLLHPSIRAELLVADGVLFTTYVFVLLAYLFFQRRLEIHLVRRFPSRWSEEKSTTLFLFGFPVITTACCPLLYESIQPDLLVAGFFLLSCGWLLNFREEKPTPLSIGFFALVLALGYLAKAIFFPLSFVFIICFYFLRRRERAGTFHAIILTVLFLTFAAVQWLPLSLDRHYFTFGETGKINYVLQVSVGGETDDGMVRQTSLDGAPLMHPVRVVSSTPAIYEFNRPLRVTYPLWYDESYWLEGLHLTLRPVRQLEVLALNFGQLLGVLAGTDRGPRFTLGVVALLSLFFLMPGRKELLLSPSWELFIPAVVGLGAYFTTGIIYRYVFGFVSVFVIGLFAHLLTRRPEPHPSTARAIALALFAVTFFVLVGQTLQSLRLTLRGHTWSELIDNPHADAALALHGLGVKEGTPVAEVGTLESTYFPVLARVRFVSVVLSENTFWNASEPEKRRIYQLLATTGAEEIIAKAPSRHFSLDGWIPIGESDFVLHHLKPSSL